MEETAVIEVSSDVEFVCGDPQVEPRVVIIRFSETIGSVAKSDDYSRVLSDPLYTLIHQALYSTDETCQANELHSQEGRDVPEIVEEECDDEDEMTKVGHHPTFFTYGSLLKGLCRGGHLKEAEKFLKSLHDVPAAVDTVMYNTLLTEMCKSGNLDKAVSLFGEMVQRSILPDSYTYTSLINGLCRKGKTVIAILFAKEAEARGNLLPNEIMYTCFVDGMFKAGHCKE